jgi:L-proline amide hydrolase
MTLAPSARSRVRFGEFETWYRVTGDLGSPRPALVVVHGGPGSTHDYLLPLTEFAVDGRAVVHYDQLGNGGSTHLRDRGAEFWTVELFLAELENLVSALGIADNYVLFGQSWGGMLVTEHAAARPSGLRGLVIANSPSSYRIWRAEMARLRADLPEGVDEELRAHEEAGTTDSEGYFEAMRSFYARHVCRISPLPRPYVASLYEMHNDPTVYHVMNGPSEFHVIGSLRDFDVLDCLPRIDVPTLVISGRHDEATPAAVRPFAEGIAGARWEIFEESSHLPHLEEPERFSVVLSEFLAGLG